MNPFLPILVALFLKPPSEIVYTRETGHWKYFPNPKIKTIKEVVINSTYSPKYFPNIVMDCSDLLIPSSDSIPINCLLIKPIGNEVRLTKELLIEQNPNILERLNNLTGCPLKIAKPEGLPKDFFKDTARYNGIICGGTTFSKSEYLIILDNNIYEGDVKYLNPNNIKSITILKDDPVGMYSQNNLPAVVIVSKNPKKARNNIKKKKEFVL